MLLVHLAVTVAAMEAAVVVDVRQAAIMRVMAVTAAYLAAEVVEVVVLRRHGEETLV